MSSTDHGHVVETSAAKVSLLTGFLGSGKTTLLNALAPAPDMGRTAVLVNEFGEIGIDHDLIEKVDEQSVLLSSGCICCSIQNDLAKALHELWSKELRGELPPIERVLIETSGLADPAPVVHTLMSDEIAHQAISSRCGRHDGRRRQWNASA